MDRDNYPVLSVDAFVRMDWKVAKDCVPLTRPPATLQSKQGSSRVLNELYWTTLPLVSNWLPSGARVHIIGTMPIASEMARTRSSTMVH